MTNVNIFLTIPVIFLTDYYRRAFIKNPCNIKTFLSEMQVV